MEVYSMLLAIPRCFFSYTVCWRSFQISTYRFIMFFVSLSTLWTLTDLRVQIPALGTWTSSSLCLFTCTLRVTAVSKRNKWDTAWRVPSTAAGTQRYSMTAAYYIPLPRGAPRGPGLSGQTLWDGRIRPTQMQILRQFTISVMTNTATGLHTW